MKNNTKSNQQDQQEQIFTDTKNQSKQEQQNNIKKDPLFTGEQRLAALNLKIDPKNPEKSLARSLVNLIANLSNPGLFTEGWDKKLREIEEAAKPLTELEQLGKKLNKAEKQFKEQFKGKDKEEAKKAFAKYTHIALSLTENSNNKDIIDTYLKDKGLSVEIKEAEKEAENPIKGIKELIKWQKEYLETSRYMPRDKDLEREKIKQYLEITKGYLPVKEYGKKVEKFLPNESERLDALNLKIDPKNPTKEGWLDINEESLVNGISAVPIISDLFEFNDNWNAKKQNMEDRTALLEPLAKTGKLLKKIEDKYKDRNGVFKDNKSKEEFAKSAVNILSNDNNQDLLEKYLDPKGFSKDETTKAITDVNRAKHILLTGKDFNKNITIKNPTQESGKKQFIEALGYKTKAELELMGLKETNDCVEILGKDFGFTLGDKGEIKHEKPETQSENYKKELKSANNINDRLEEGAEGKFNYSEQNTESEAQKIKEKAGKEADNKNYSRTSTNTPQSGMSAENMAGNAAVLGGAIAAAAVIPFVGWIVALAILYSFKDKFKDDLKAEKELYENVAKGLEKEGGQTPAQAQETIDNLKKQVAELKKRESENKTTPQDDIITDLAKHLEEKPGDIKKITDISNKQNNKEELKDFLKKEVYKGKATNEQKKGIEDLINPNNLQKIIDTIKESQEKNEMSEKKGKTPQIFQYELAKQSINNPFQKQNPNSLFK